MPELKTIPISQIRVPDVRVSSILDAEQKALLDTTIREVGVIQDPVVRQLQDGSYELVSGKSRISALAAQGKTEVQVKVLEADEKTGLIMNVIENVARGTYDYVSISRAIRRLRSLGASTEELEKIFPWRARWIEFLEQLQDLPDDVTAAITARKITPTHVQLALNLPTPAEVHSGLRTAINLGWDTGTFKIFVQNRIEQLERAKQKASEQGSPVEIPAAVPEELIKYKQCLLCGYQKNASEVTIQFACNDCVELVKYVTAQLGPSEQAIYEIYNALAAYYGQPRPTTIKPPEPRPGSSQG